MITMKLNTALCCEDKDWKFGTQGEGEISWPLTFVVVDFVFHIFSLDVSLSHV
jgi:hypothetical protein